MAQWESLPADRLSEDRFLVDVGDETRSSKIIESIGEAADPDTVIAVPADYRNDFEADLEAALRDLAGIPIGGVSAFLKKRETIEKGTQMHDSLFSGHQLFAYDSVDLSTFGADLSRLLDDEYLKNTDVSTGYFACVDLALTGDSCGIAVGHCGGFKAVGKSTNWDETLRSYVTVDSCVEPIVIADGLLEIVPPHGDEIDIEYIGNLLELINARVPLEIVTADSFQSAALLQRMRKVRTLRGRRLRAGVLSVDVTIAPYSEVKQALRDERLIFPNVAKCKKELRELIFDPRAQKIDHPVEGSKDVSDALAAVTYIAVRRNSNKSLAGTAGRALLAGIDAAETQSTPKQVRPKGAGHRVH